MIGYGICFSSDMIKSGTLPFNLVERLRFPCRIVTIGALVMLLMSVNQCGVFEGVIYVGIQIQVRGIFLPLLLFLGLISCNL